MGRGAINEKISGVSPHVERPWFESVDWWMTYACAPKLEEAQREALGHMATLLTERVGVTRDQVNLLLAARGRVHRPGSRLRSGLHSSRGLPEDPAAGVSQTASAPGL